MRKRALVTVATVGAIGVAAVAARRRKKDVTDDRVRAARSMTVRRRADELYAMWRSPEVLSVFLHHVQRVEANGERRQRWFFDSGGTAHELDVEIVDDQPGQRIEWRVLPQGPFEAQCFVTFLPAPAERGTEVRFTLALSGPGAGAMSSFARVFGASVAQIAKESVRNLKALAEAGEAPKAVRD